MKSQALPSILLVEDDDIDTEIVLDLLADNGVSNPVVTARDGQEALDALHSGDIAQPCLILLDLNMPRMNGLEFLEHVRADKDTGQDIVFVLTTSDRPEDVAAAYRHNVAGYVVKDDAAELVNLLGAYCTINRFPAPAHA